MKLDGGRKEEESQSTNDNLVVKLQMGEFWEGMVSIQALN